MSNKVKNMRTVLFMLFAALSLSVSAQTITLSGNVQDTTGEPVIGASIVEKGNTSNGTITDLDGNFSLKVSSKSTVIVSYIGMKSQEVALNGQSKINVTLIDDAKALEEVVVIGYGTAKRKDLTGSVGSVNSDAIAAVPVASAVEAITGKLAGVQVTTTEGSPDAEMKIRVRGGGSITQSNEPLYIVDGFPVNSISDIAPTDIESIDVLKDASSTAIYGSRGANGVIIVTTKGGKEGKVNVAYNAYVGWKKQAKKLDVLSPYDYASWQYEAAMLQDKPENYTKYFGNFQDMDLYKEVTPNDWQDLVFGRTGFTFNQNLSINGGSEKIKYAFSYNHMNDKAIMVQSGYKRDNLSLKLNSKPNKAVTIDFNVRYSKTDINGSGANEQREVSSADSRLKNVMLYPSFPVKGLTDSDETDDGFNLYQPLEYINDNDQRQSRTTFNMGGGATWEVIENLRLRSEVSLDDFRNDNTRFYGTTTYYVKNVPATENKGLPAISFEKTTRRTFRNTNTINYDFKKLLPQSHKLNLLLGQEYIKTEDQVFTSVVHGFEKSFTLAQANNLSAMGKSYSTDNFLYPDDMLLSFFGRLNYDYLSKYIFSATFRADGSSKFGEGNKWGYFPSAALAWRVSSESFMEGTKAWLDDLKLRVSYGTAGNNGIPSGVQTQGYTATTTSYVNGYNSYWAPSKIMANPDLKWETTVTRNIGLDYTIMNGRLSGSVEVYLNDTKDLLIQYPTAGTGYDYQYRNMGKTENKGLEASINWVAIDKKNVGLSLSANIGFNKNEVKSLGDMNYVSGESGWASTEIGTDYWIAVGGSIGKMYGYKSAGRYEVSDFTGYDAATNKWTLKEGVVNSSGALNMDVSKIRPGTMKLQDTTNDDKVTLEDRVVIGDANPLHTGGFTLNARLYGFDMTAGFNWSYGNDVYNANKIEYTSTSKYNSRNMITEMETGKRWTNLLEDGTICNDPAKLAEMNANTTLWSPYMARFMFTDWAVEDGSFLRLNTLTLGYTLPKSLTQKAKIQNCRFYVTGYNVFCLTNYSGFDPEVSTRRKTGLTPGVDYSAYPKSRSFVVGLNLNF